MKLVPIFLVIYLSCQDSFAKSEKRSAVNRTVSNSIMYVTGAYSSPVLTTRCIQTLKCNSVKNGLACHGGIAKFMTAAQFNKPQNALALQAREYLTDDRSEVDNSGRAVKCLDILNKRIDNGESFNLWTETLRCYRGKKHQAIKFLATTFSEVTTGLIPRETDYERKKFKFIKSLIPLIRNGKIQGYPPGVDVRKSGLYRSS